MLIVSSFPMRTIIMCGFLFHELFCLFMLLVCCDCGNVGLNMNNHNQHMIAIHYKPSVQSMENFII